MSITDSSVYFTIIANIKKFLDSLKAGERGAGSFTDSVGNNLDKVKKDVERFGDKCYDSFNSVAYALESAFSVAKNTISGLVGSFADYGDTIAKMSERTGIAAQTLSEFEYIAGQCGTNLGAFETAIKTMEKTLAGAANGASEAQGKLSQLGVSFFELQNKSPDQQFRTIAEAIARLPDPSQRAAAAMAMFGRSGTDLLPLMNAGAGAIDELAQKAHDLGLVLSDEDYQAAEDAKDAMDNFKRSLDGVKMQLSSALTPMLTSVANGFAKVSSKVIALAQSNPNAARTIAVVVAAVAGCVTALYAGAKAAQAFNAALLMINAHPVIAAITAIGVALVALTAHFMKVKDSADTVAGSFSQIAAENSQMRKTHNDYMATLQELAGKQSLTNEEIKQAQFYASSLNAAYGDLGITVDATTGKIDGLTGAMLQMAEAQKQARLADINLEKTDIKEQLGDQEVIMWRLRTKYGQEEASKRADYQQARERTKALNQKLTALNQQEYWLNHGLDDGAEKGEPIPASYQSGPSKAQESAAAMAKNLAHANDTVTEREINRLNDEFEDIVKKRAEEIQKAENISAEEANKRAREELVGLRARVDAQIKSINDKAAADKQKEEDAEKKRSEDEEKRKAEERERNTLSEVDTKRAEFDQRNAELVATLQKAIADGNVTAVQETVKKLEDLDQERQQFEQQTAADRLAKASDDYKEKEKALDEAQKTGNQEDIDKANKELKESAEELAAAQQGAASFISDQQRLIQEAEEARARQMEEDAETAEENSEIAHEEAKKYEAQGTFNAASAASLGQANDYSKKICETSEEQLRYLRYIYEGQNNQQQTSAVFA